METIKIAHLYYDLMNLYGEHGNVRCLTHHLESHDVRVIVHNLSIDDKIKFDDYLVLLCKNKAFVNKKQIFG